MRFYVSVVGCARFSTALFLREGGEEKGINSNENRILVLLKGLL